MGSGTFGLQGVLLLVFLLVLGVSNIVPPKYNVSKRQYYIIYLFVIRTNVRGKKGKRTITRFIADPEIAM